MDKKTYEAIKNITNFSYLAIHTPEMQARSKFRIEKKDIQTIEAWIAEVAKDYTECDDCGDEMKQHSTIKDYFYCWECWGQREPDKNEITN